MWKICITDDLETAAVKEDLITIEDVDGVTHSVVADAQCTAYKSPTGKDQPSRRIVSATWLYEFRRFATS